MSKEKVSTGCNDLFGTPIENVDKADELRNIAINLWQMLDDIDTLDDSCRDNDKAFRDATRKRQQLRHKFMVSDGYNLFLPKAT